MKTLPDRVKTVSLDSTGETTKTRFMGTFRAKVVMTNSERFEMERYYREELPKDDGASEERKLNAAVIAELRVRVVSGPKWWEGSREGRDLIEMQPLYDLLVQINKEYETWLKEVQEVTDKQE